MPIKDKSVYPDNWKEIRQRILERANHCCEQCGVSNYDIGYRDEKEVWNKIEQSMQGDTDAEDAKETGFKVIKIVLTIAHLDHNPKNNDESNLKALCQLHHLRYDINHHKENSRNTRNKNKKLQTLF